MRFILIKHLPMSQRSSILSRAAILALGVLGVIGCSREPNELVVYSSRNEQLIKPLFDRYTADTGQAIRFVTDDAGPLIERLAAEGKNSPADVLITVDAGQLWQAADRGILRAVESDVLKQNIPEHLKDPDNRWFGLSVRARTLVHSTERVKPETLNGYEDLAAEEWKGRLCLRTSKSVYNQSLVAMMIAAHGEQRAEEIVRGWVANLAAEPFANDTRLMEAIVAGQCDVGIVNSYYFGRLLRDKPDLPIKLFWAQLAGEGVHVNVSGAGVTAAAPHAKAAQKFLEWLSQPEAQSMFANANLEYPANPNVTADPLVASWGTFRASPLNVAKAGELQADAVRLMDRAGFR